MGSTSEPVFVGIDVAKQAWRLPYGGQARPGPWPTTMRGSVFWWSGCRRSPRPSSRLRPRGVGSACCCGDGMRWSACGCGESETCARLCPFHRTTCQDRQVGRQSVGPFAQAVQPQVRPLRTEEEETLAALVTRRRQVIEMIVAESNRLCTVRPCVRERIEKHLEWLREELKALEDEIGAFIEGCSLWKDKEELLRSVPGVGETTAGYPAGAVTRVGRPERATDRCARGGCSCEQR